MRTTLDIDDDVLHAAKDIAAHRKQSIGKVISEVFRRNVRGASHEAVRNGVSVIQREPEAKLVTMGMINQMRDELP
jgi:hypothetical protein